MGSVLLMAVIVQTVHSMPLAVPRVSISPHEMRDTSLSDWATQRATSGGSCVCVHRVLGSHALYDSSYKCMRYSQLATRAIRRSP